MKKLKILYIAGVSPYHFANMIYDCMLALEKDGHEVDFITLNEFSGQKKNMFNIYGLSPIYKLRNIYLSSPFLKKIRNLLWGKHKIIHKKPKLSKNGYLMENMYENISPVPVKLIFEKLTNKYDLIIASVWENIISAETLRLLYEHYKVPIIMHAADMYPFTGGCQYPGNCTNYVRECGNCPILDSHDWNDQTHKNYLYKKNVYSNIKCALLSNSYMLGEAKKSGLFEQVLLKKRILTVNESVYYQHDIYQSRELLGIPEQKKFILFARYVDPVEYPRKGIDGMIHAINIFCEGKTEEELNSMCLMLAGDSCDYMYGKIPISIIYVGKLSTEMLIKAYSASTIFVSPSIGDGGPSMVNQSIMCGTPVVCFNIGTAIDVIEHKQNGYKAKLGDENSLADGFEYIWNLNEVEYSAMRRKSRDIGVERQSLASYARVILDSYNDLV